MLGTIGAIAGAALVVMGRALTDILVERILGTMPRKKSVVPDSISPAEYPQWFAEYTEKQQGKGRAVDWLADYEASDILAIVVSILTGGGALFVSSTRDGGAIGFTVMYGDSKKRFYVTSAEELDDFVRKVAG